MMFSLFLCFEKNKSCNTDACNKFVFRKIAVTNHINIAISARKATHVSYSVTQHTLTHSTTET